MEEQKSITKPKVIVISGSVGSGKSTVAAKLSELLEHAPILIFDDYEQFVEWPENNGQWIKDGTNPKSIRVPKLKDDLLLLLNGESIEYPVGDKIVKPGNYIILEEPSGRERDEIREFIDIVIYIDVPQDICVIRMIQRVMNMEIWETNETFEKESKEELVRQLDAVAMWTSQYQRARSMYMNVSCVVKHNADIVVNGLMKVNEITNEVMDAIKPEKEKQSCEKNKSQSCGG